MLIKKNKSNLFFIIALIGLLASYIYFYNSIPKEEKKLKDTIIRYTTETSVNIIKNIILFEIFQDDSSVDVILRSKKIRTRLLKILRTIKDDKVQYVFIIFKDKDKFRYIVDPSAPVNYYKTLFIPFKEEIRILNRVLARKKSEYLINNKMETLGITYYIPLGKNIILIIDFSFKTLQEINAIVNKVKQIFLFLIGFTFILILFSLTMFLRVFIINKRLFEDPLTKVFNRKYLAEIENSIDLKEYIVAIVDIDFFKHINDTYGHKVGDEILKLFAKTLKENLRKEDIVIRYGGEEFLILLKKDRKLTNRKVLVILERLINIIRSTTFNNLKITASFGVNLDTDKARNLNDAIKKADLALYKAKKEGRDRIEIYTEKKEEEISLSDLKEIIEKEEFTFFFQPIVNLKTKEVLYYESLLRFKYQGEIIPPFKYLEMIKETFLYSKLSRKIIEKNAEILQKYPFLRISINLSPQDLINESTVDFLLKIDEGIINRLKLEIIETEDIRNFELLKTNVEKLKTKGYKIALDDFGKGYINFFYLTEIPASYIKIDGSIVKNIYLNEKYYILCKNVFNFAKEMNIEVIAEFVENKEIVDKLIEIGIKYGQGYYFSKPKPLKEIIKEEK